MKLNTEVIWYRKRVAAMYDSYAMAAEDDAQVGPRALTTLQRLQTARGRLTLQRQRPNLQIRRVDRRSYRPIQRRNRRKRLKNLQNILDLRQMFSRMRCGSL